MTKASSPSEPRTYDAIFWLSYVANFALVTANATTFRFAEIVEFMGGTEKTAGFIVSCGVLAALCGRVFLGQAIDRFGVRRLWLAAAAGLVSGALLLAAAESIGPLIYAGRVIFAIGLAGMFTGSVFHAQQRAPAARRTEVIGNLGSSGFLGMISGSQLCDFLGRRFDGLQESRAVFVTVAVLGILYAGLILLITRRDRHVRPRETPSALRLLRDHWPGPIVLIALLMGMYFVIPSVLLTRLSTHRDLGGIGTFWTAYAIAAFVFRVMTRHWSQTVGRHRMVLLGIAGHLVGHAGLIFVTDGWQLIGPAISCGFGHALLFPAIVSLGTESFPREYRGTGTTLVLGFLDLGTLTSAPVLGAIIVHFGGVGFEQMLGTSVACSVFTLVVYTLTGARRPDSDLVSPHREPSGSPPNALPSQEPRESRHRTISP